MNILIAGCGYVGTRLATRLVDAGHTVYGMRRSPPGPVSGLSWLQGDLGQPSVIPRSAAVDALVLAAGLRRDTGDRYQALFVESYGRLLSGLIESGHPLARIVMISTTGVFAERDGGIITERSPVNTDAMPGRYYLAAERLVMEAGIPSSVVRLSGIYGPGRIRLIREVRDGKARRFGAPVHYLNHLHADDAAGAVAHVLGLSHPDPLYIASDREPADRDEVLQWIADEIGRGTLPFASDSERPARRSGNKRCSSDLLVASGYRFRYPTYREGYRALIAG